MADQEESQNKEESPENALASFKRSLTDEIDKFFDESTIEAQKQSKTKVPLVRLDVANCGPVELMTMPPGWVEKAGESQPATRVFHHPEQTYCRIELSVTPKQYEESVAQLFTATLERTHFLTPSEVRSIRAILGEQADESIFHIVIAAVKEINGRSILLVEGRYIATDVDNLCAYIDADGTARNIHTFRYSAPRTLWPVHYAKVNAALKSIKWQALP